MLLQGTKFYQTRLTIESGAFSPSKLLVKLPLNDPKQLVSTLHNIIYFKSTVPSLMTKV